MTELLIELFSEEIPARMQEDAAQHLTKALLEGLKQAGLRYSDANYYYTPRRLCAHITDIPLETAATTIERRGPKIGAPDQALNGFLKSTGLTKKQLVTQDTPKGSFYFAKIDKPAVQTSQIIAELLPQIIRNFPWPKSMRWSDGPLKWVRPLHHILCLFDGKIVELTIDHLTSGDFTFGHRFMAPDKITVQNFVDYQQKLEKSYVILDQKQRKADIIDKITTEFTHLNVALLPDQALAQEVAGLVEYPVPLIGTIEVQFQDLPSELLTLTMKTHQKYFSGQDQNSGKITHFATIANIQTQDQGQTILNGNQRVLAARLSDAQFFYQQDLQKSLEEHGKKLKNVTYHAKLESQTDRIERIRKIAHYLSEFISVDKPLLDRAVTLAKCDLTTHIVGEFPELQGIIGKYYALEQGENADIAGAIENHYLPKGAGDITPEKPLAVIIALADRLDQLCGFWAINEKPTSSKDPFALRRAALGIIRILIQNKISLNIFDILCHNTKHYKEFTSDEFANDLLSFFQDRLKIYLKDQGMRHDVINAVLIGDDFYKISDNAHILNKFIITSKGEAFLAAYKRATNILNAEDKAGTQTFENNVSPALFVLDAEKSFNTAIDNVMHKLSTDHTFEGKLDILAALAPDVMTFFDDVIVNDDDPKIRQNRLDLLRKFEVICCQETSVMVRNACDFSKLEG